MPCVPSPGPAASPPGNAMETNPVQLHCLGVGPGWPCPDRNGSAYLYQAGGLRLLCDCAEGASRALKASGVGLEAIDRILLTHLHFDHVGGLFFYLQGCWVERRRDPLTIHLPAHGLPAVREMLRQGFILDELFPFELRWEPWEPGRTVDCEGVQVTPVPTTHLDGLKQRHPTAMPAGAVAYAFEFRAAGKRWIHSGDVGSPADLAPLLEEPADLLLCEVAHIEPPSLFRFLAGRPVRRLVMTHLPVGLWDERDRLLAEARARLPEIQVELATEGSRFEF
ncbi:MAG: MBL fold metallo-hydrolase [Verrucomicrobia bacterium]|nr:MAG: MBL fold metallo-hydrolase [Verrucomicrobiota bacterium]